MISISGNGHRRFPDIFCQEKTHKKAQATESALQEFTASIPAFVLVSVVFADDLELSSFDFSGFQALGTYV